jgi:hypothetical protein
LRAPIYAAAAEDFIRNNPDATASEIDQYAIGKFMTAGEPVNLNPVTEQPTTHTPSMLGSPQAKELSGGLKKYDSKKQQKGK